MSAGTLDQADRPRVVDDDQLCFHFWQSGPSAYFEYMRSPETLSAMVGNPSSIGCGVEDAIESISKAASGSKS